MSRNTLLKVKFLRLSQVSNLSHTVVGVAGVEVTAVITTEEKQKNSVMNGTAHTIIKSKFNIY